MNYITRKGKFDAGHRVMHERFKCFNVHGHEFHYEMTFSTGFFDDIGYAIDFKEIKRVGCQWIDDTLDHGFIANPADIVMIQACQTIKSKHYIMSLREGDDNYCNPTAENIAKELFFSMAVLLNQPSSQEAVHPNEYKLKLVELKLHETIDCYVKCTGLSEKEWAHLLTTPLYEKLCAYRTQKGQLEYDERKVVV